MRSVNCGLLLDWLTYELHFKTSGYFNSELEDKIVSNACTVEIQLQKFFLISASRTFLCPFVPRVRVIFCWFSDLPQLSCSTSACLNETTFIMTNFMWSSCCLTSIGFFESCRVAAWHLLSKVWDVHHLLLYRSAKAVSSFAASLTVKRVPCLSVWSS